MVDPDHVRASQRDRVTAPDVLRVELGDVNVLDDDVFDTEVVSFESLPSFLCDDLRRTSIPVGHPDTLALDDTFRARADNRLVGSDLDRVKTSFIVGDRGGGCVGLVVAAPIVLVDGSLAASASAPRCATRSGHGRTSEVECLAQQNDARARVSQVGDQLLVGGRSNDLSGLDDTG
jgi:hypothetical protein